MPSLGWRVRAGASTVLFWSGLLHLASWLKLGLLGDRLLIIAFHCVSDPGRPYFRRGMDIDREDLAGLLRQLQRRYRFTTLREAMQERKSPVAVVTFDDAYRSVYDVAFPVLTRLGIPATLFVPTDFVGTGMLLWWDRVHRLHGDEANATVSRLKYAAPSERRESVDRMCAEAGKPPEGERLMITWDEIRELAASGFEIGSHTAGHVYLDELEGQALAEELGRAHETIEREVGTPPTTFSYPDGRFSDKTIAELKRLGYTGAVTTMNGMNRGSADPFLLRRWDGAQSFKGASGRVCFPLAWAEMLGVWDALFLRRWRNPERFTPFRPKLTVL